MLKDDLLIQFSALFAALADPTRARILLLLLEKDMRSTDIAKALTMTSSAVSHQLRWLRERKVVSGERQGREVVYQLADDCIREIICVALHHIQEGN